MTAGLGLPRVHHRVTDSTNLRAVELAAAGAPHGTLVTASEQTAGRGRQGRAWTAPPGSALLMSVVVRGLERHHALPLAVPVAVCEACEAAAAPVRCEIKWPNDVWVEGRKLAGILIEGRPQEGWTVVGIGVNVTTAPEQFPPELRESATSLAQHATGASVEGLLGELLPRMAGWAGAPPERVLAAWRDRDALAGGRVRWAGGEGTARGVAPSGALIVETSDGELELGAGEVHLLT